MTGFCDEIFIEANFALVTILDDFCYAAVIKKNMALMLLNESHEEDGSKNDSKWKLVFALVFD